MGRELTNQGLEMAKQNGTISRYTLGTPGETDFGVSDEYIPNSAGCALILNWNTHPNEAAREAISDGMETVGFEKEISSGSTEVWTMTGLSPGQVQQELDEVFQASASDESADEQIDEPWTEDTGFGPVEEKDTPTDPFAEPNSEEEENVNENKNWKF